MSINELWNQGQSNIKVPVGMYKFMRDIANE